MLKNRERREEQGFTLIEIMVVVVILGILAAIVVPKLMSNPDRARRTAAKVQIKQIEEALFLYRLDNGDYPSTEQGLAALVSAPTIGDIPRNYREGGYLSKIPKDPWGNDYLFISPGGHGDFDLVSYGADREQGGEGVDADIENWNLD